MCNAWNHSPGCTCGFGGDGHLGGGGGFGRPTSIDSEIYRQIYESLALDKLRIDKGKYESYVNPNAVCPVCGASVFFYQSPDGGRVFFDELTPPWPKHPCTDNGQVPKENTEFNSLKPKSMEHGWLPLHTFAPTPVEGHFLIKGYILTDAGSNFIVDYFIKEDPDFENSDLKFYREIDEDRFEIIYLNLKNDRIAKIIGYKRDSAIKSGLGRYIPIEIGEELIVEFRGVDLGFRIQVTPVDRSTSLKWFIDKRDIKKDTKKKINIVPHVKFTFKAKVISIKREIILREV